MINRFEIPVESPGFNTFLVDDYLRSLRSHDERIKLINTHGYSAEKREDFERQSGLPHGAVELALICEDRQVIELNKMVTDKMKKLYEEKASPEQVKAAFNDMDIGSRAAGIKALYPEAFQFLSQYAALSRRTASSFRGDYPINNEFKIALADCSPSANVNAGGPCGLDPSNFCVNITVVVNVFAFGFAYAYVVAVAWVIAAAFVALAIYVWAAVFVIP
jgi:hypothetical protein